MAALALGVMACGGPPPETSSPATGNGGESGGVDTDLSGSAADPERWPRDFVAGPGTGPALYLNDDPRSPAIGYITEGVHFRIGGLPQNERIPVRIRGALKVRAWMSVSRLALRVQQRGKIGGTEVYVGPGDYVRFVSPDAEEGLARVEAMPRFSYDAMGAAATGVYPFDRLSPEAPPADAEAPASGTTMRTPANTEVAIYSSPDEVITTLPALDPGVRLEVLRDRGEWKGVRAGVGPYIVGYVNVDLVEPGELEEPPTPPTSEDVPLRLQNQQQNPLWRLPAGTRVRFDDETIGILDEDGYGREMNRYESTGEVDMFVAANDEVALRGMVRIDDLQPIEGEGDAAAE